MLLERQMKCSCHSTFSNLTIIKLFLDNNFGLPIATLALGSRPRQRGCKVTGREEGTLGVKARGSPGVTSHTPGSVRKCARMNLHTPKATPTLGDGLPVDSRNFREQLRGSNLNVLWRSLYD